MCVNQFRVEPFLASVPQRGTLVTDSAAPNYIGALAGRFYNPGGYATE